MVIRQIVTLAVVLAGQARLFLRLLRLFVWILLVHANFTFTAKGCLNQDRFSGGRFFLPREAIAFFLDPSTLPAEFRFPHFLFTPVPVHFWIVLQGLCEMVLLQIICAMLEVLL